MATPRLTVSTSVHLRRPPTVSDERDGETLDLDGEAKLTRASIEQRFEGDLEADAAAEVLMHYPDGGDRTPGGRPGVRHR